MPDAFISYSRQDSKAFAIRLHAALERHGKDAWIDLDDIPPASRWEEDLREGVGKCDAFLFVISPGSVVSAPCLRELEYAAERNKKIIPLRSTAVEERGKVPENLRALNWIPSDGAFEDRFDTYLERLIDALETDLEWTRAHTRWGIRAEEWDEKDREKSLLLRGAELEDAERWLAGQAGKKPEPTDLQRTYVFASRQASTRRQRFTLGAVLAALVVFAALAVVALLQRNEAISQRNEAVSRQLAATALDALRSDPELGLLIAIEAAETDDTDAAVSALRRSLAESRLRAVFAGHEDGINDVAFSPDGRLLMTAANDGARIRDVESHETLRLLDRGKLLESGTFSADGNRVATAGGGTAKIWDVGSGRETKVLRDHGDPVKDIAFSPDGRSVATASDDTARIWDAETGHLLAMLPSPGDPLDDVAFSPDGHSLATASLGGPARVWDLDRRKVLWVFGSPRAPVESVTFSPDGRFVATGGNDGTTRIWNLASGQKARVLRGNGPVVWSVAFSPDGRLLVTGDGDGTARIWDTATGLVLAVLRGHGDLINTVTLSPDGRTVATASFDRSARLWAVDPLPDLALLRGHTGLIKDIAYSPDGRSLATASADGTARIWDAESGEQLMALRTQQRRTFFEGVTFSPDGKLVATASASVPYGAPSGRSHDGEAAIWDAETGRKMAMLHGDGGPVRSIAFSPDGELIATASDEGETTIWDAATGEEMFVLQGRRYIAKVDGEGVGLVSVLDVAFSPDGELVATASDDGETTIWDSETGEELTPLSGHSAPVSDIAFSLDGRSVATASFDQTARTWDARTGSELSVLQGHTGSVQAVGISPDGQIAATASHDGTARIWDAQGGNELGIIGGRGFGEAVAFSLDGRRLAISTDQIAHIYACDFCVARDVDDLLALARERVTREMTAEEQNLYLPD